MLIVVSPAKKLDMEPIDGLDLTKPQFSNNVLELMNIARNLSVNDLQKLMKISPSLAQLNKERFNQFGNQEKKAAIYAFAGDTYKGLDVKK